MTINTENMMNSYDYRNAKVGDVFKADYVSQEDLELMCVSILDESDDTVILRVLNYDDMDHADKLSDILHCRNDIHRSDLIVDLTDMYKYCFVWSCNVHNDRKVSKTIRDTKLARKMYSKFDILEDNKIRVYND